MNMNEFNQTNEQEFVAMLKGGFYEVASSFYMQHYRVMDHALINKAMREYDTQNKTYLYMITFTVDPKKWSDPPYDKIEKYIENVPKRKALTPLKCSYVRETHKNGRFHYHMKLQTRKWLRSDAFNQYKKVYGNVDVSRSKTNDPSYIDLYIYKEGIPKELL